MVSDVFQDAEDEKRRKKNLFFVNEGVFVGICEWVSDALGTFYNEIFM